MATTHVTFVSQTIRCCSFSTNDSMEAKKRGLKASGKKDQILTRLLIWIRDEIAQYVEPIAEANGNDFAPTPELSSSLSDSQVDTNLDEEVDCTNVHNSDFAANSDEECDDPNAESKTIELSNDDSSDIDYNDDGDSSCDELEICKKDAPITNNTEPTLYESLEKIFGYTDFREGQEWAIRRCLSLCYALPAALMEGICLVVSPLISLMQVSLHALQNQSPIFFEFTHTHIDFTLSNVRIN